MLIKKVKYKEHPILGDLELDLINSVTGKTYKTIILAGENGSGKSTILETISTFLNQGSFENFEYIKYTSNQKNLEALPREHPNIKNFYRMKDDEGSIINMDVDKNNRNETLDNNPLNIRYNGCIFSKARADYKTKPVKNTGTEDIDLDKYDLDEKEDFTSLKQLLIDIQSQDDENYSSTNRDLCSQGRRELSWTNFYTKSKTYRFKEAFNNFFEKIKYDKVSNLNNEKNVLFSKNGANITIDQLSTGEKQIVFRGAYLLRNISNLKKAVIMIDEPELSMHPKWEQKILNYYQNLFTEDSIQNAQIFIATHSEHVLKEALKDKENNLVIVLKESSGIIEVKNIDAPNVLPSITSAETNYLAFDIISNDYHIELYDYLQTKENKSSIKQCDNFIKDHGNFNSTLHGKTSSYTNPRNGSTTDYETLPTYIRNAIDHPGTTGEYTEEELRTSIEFLIELCR